MICPSSPIPSLSSHIETHPFKCGCPLVLPQQITSHIQELLKEARSRLEAAIALVKLPPWPAAAVAASPMAAAYLFHRFGKSLRLVANIVAFDSLLPRDALMSMVFERVFQQQVRLKYQAFYELIFCIQTLSQTWLLHSSFGRCRLPLKTQVHLSAVPL